jgi:hypothetical protein
MGKIGVLMTLEEKIKEYFETKTVFNRKLKDDLIGNWLCMIIASDLSKLIDGEVVAEGNLKTIFYHADSVEIKFNDYPSKIALGKPMNKNVKVQIILREVEK